VPSGLGGGKDGVLIPSSGVVFKSDSISSLGHVTTNGHASPVSPQWGWYISTTPPSPDKYYYTVEKRELLMQNQQHQEGQNSPSLSQSIANESAVLPTSVSRTPAFTRDVKNNLSGAEGWPTVPLQSRF